MAPNSSSCLIQLSEIPHWSEKISFTVKAKNFPVDAKLKSICGAFLKFVHKPDPRVEGGDNVFSNQFVEVLCKNCGKRHVTFQLWG